MEPRRTDAVDAQPKMAECASLFRPTLVSTHGADGQPYRPSETNLGIHVTELGILYQNRPEHGVKMANARSLFSGTKIVPHGVV